MVKCKVVPLLMIFMLLGSGFLAMFIDSITVLLFLAALTIELARMLKFNPVPLIIAEIFAAKIAAVPPQCVATLPNIIIGTAFGYTFADFFANTGPIAWAGMLFTLGFFYFAFRKILIQPDDPEALMRLCPVPSTAISNPRLFKISTGIFLAVVILLITHAETGISVALIGAVLPPPSPCLHPSEGRLLLKRVDWRTRFFFIGLFVCVGGLEESGVLQENAGGVYRKDIGGQYYTRDTHHTMGLRLYSRHSGQHPVRGNNGAGDRQPVAGARPRPANPGLDTGAGYRHRG